MDVKIDSLKLLINNLKNIGFFKRIFGWRQIRNELIDAAADLQILTTTLDHQASRISALETAKALTEKDLFAFQQANHSLTSENILLKERNNNLTAGNKTLSESEAVNLQTISASNSRQSELLIELAGTKKDLKSLQDVLEDLQKLNTQLTKDEEFRKNEHSNSIASLTTIQKNILEERNKEVEERNFKAIERITLLKETWKRHQDIAKASIKEICQRHTVEYIDKVSFKGDPDNTLHICGEFVVLDAKSPGSDDLKNFPLYLKDQAEKAKKYAKQENVKSDIFFIVPTNTLDYLDTFVYRHGDHNVYIISVDALEPVILCLKKIEEYEFAEQLSPEDRESICRVLGRFAHLSKRRIQVDSFFAKQFIELAYKCEADLPKEMLESVMEFERSEKLNPPMEKRAKSIPIADVVKDIKTVNHEADMRGIIVQDEKISTLLDGLPLYKS